MVSLREQVTQDISVLSEVAVQRVAEFITFIKFQERFNPLAQLDETELARLYAEAADEDHELAEAGMADYAAGLAAEDRQ